MRKLFVFSILLILLLVIIVEVISVSKIQKTINMLKEEHISFVTVIYENKKTILTDENIIYEIVNKIDNILAVKQDVIKQSFTRGDTQDVVEFIITTSKNENIEITFAYSSIKELSRISISAGSVKYIYKVINLSEEVFKSLVAKLIKYKEVE